MKHVAKGQPPESLERWKSLASADWQPTYPSLRNPEKGELHLALLIEQGWVCCYCGRSITQKDSHIEHFRPQEHYPERALDHDNLHASCIRETHPGMPLHCGHAKGSELNEGLALSPVDPTCEHRFRYTFDGRLIGTDDNATYMSSLLKLEIPFLVNRRAAVIEGVFTEDLLTTLTNEELRTLRDRFAEPDAQGRLPSFGHVITRLASQWLEGPGT